MADKIGHRRVGSGSVEVRVAAPVAGVQSGRVFIGRALWQRLGSPARVDLVRGPGALVVKAGDRFAVSGAASNGEPRVSIGVSTMEALSLRPGVYAAEVEGTNKRRIVAHIAPGETENSPTRSPTRSPT